VHNWGNLRYNVAMLKFVRAFIFGAAIVFTASFFAAPAYAANYGEGSYNNCAYTCAKKTTQETKVTLASGLVVTINLSNGQKISPDGYVVIVQPANGQKGTLKQADFYVNNILEETGSPNEVGAVRWLWKPAESNGNVRVKIIITAQDGAISTQEFTVSIEEPDPEPVAATAQPEDPGVVGTVSRAVFGFVGSLPTPVIYALPYFLFGLLLINIILLLIQTQREIREIATLQRIISIERNTGIEKNAFMSLTSHYLRTPLSIIQGGFDLMVRTNAIPANANAQAQQTLENLRLKVDSLLARSDVAGSIAGISDEQLPSIWKKPGLYLPIVLIGVLVAVFNYVAANVGSFDVSTLNIIMQIVAFSLLAVVFYQVYRRRQLHRRDSAGMQQALAHEQAINQSRDELITESANLLSGDLQTLRDIARTLPESNARQFVNDGIQRFREVLGKFAIAGQLRSGRAKQPGTTTSLQTLLNALPKPITDRLAQKGVKISMAADSPFITSNPQLVAYVVASLLDNAADYSRPQDTIEIRAFPGTNSTEITVTDHGAGIEPQKISTLFKPFTQTQDVERFTHEGMGFSLYLDKLIMTYLGGSISLNSKPNVETTATITIPHLTK
jgi:signal transduction histidine kinase